jgi:hypothetical protein
VRQIELTTLPEIERLRETRRMRIEDEIVVVVRMIRAMEFR